MKQTGAEKRVEFKRSDFPNMERGRFFNEASKGTTEAVIEPKLARTFPTSVVISEVLRGLLALADETARMTGHRKQTSRKRAAV